MLLSSLAFAATTLALADATPSHAHQPTSGPIRIERPWTRATPGGAKVGGGFMTITNTGSTADRLIGGSSPVSAHFEVHEMVDDKGIMRMRMMEKGLEILPGQTVELKPGGYHVMFIDLKAPLKQGERVKGTLRFEKAGEIEVEYVVEAIGAGGSGEHGGHGKGSGKGSH